jgi:hypothetical protein
LQKNELLPIVDPNGSAAWTAIEDRFPEKLRRRFDGRFFPRLSFVDCHLFLGRMEAVAGHRLLVRVGQQTPKTVVLD